MRSRKGCSDFKMIIKELKSLSVLHLTTYGNFNKYLKKNHLCVSIGNTKLKELVLVFK